MKKSVAMMLSVVSMAVITSTAVAAGDEQASWTFDDFNSDCELVNDAEAKVAETDAAVSAPDIPWTFDDFNSDCELVENAEVQAIDTVAATADPVETEEVGELGW